jgi:hypothetical protein
MLLYTHIIHAYYTCVHMKPSSIHSFVFQEDELLPSLFSCFKCSKHLKSLILSISYSIKIEAIISSQSWPLSHHRTGTCGCWAWCMLLSFHDSYGQFFYCCSWVDPLHSGLGTLPSVNKQDSSLVPHLSSVIPIPRSQLLNRVLKPVVSSPLSPSFSFQS